MSSIPQVSCIIPTMNRPALLKQTLTRLFQSTQGIDVEAVVVIDGSVDSVFVAAEIAREHNVSIDYSPARRGAITCWNIGLARARADIFFHMGDDLEFSDGWLAIALEAHRTKLQGYGVLGVNDSMHNGNVIATHAIFDRQFCIDHLGGVMACPLYRYYCVDNEFNERAKRVGKFYWAENAVVNHIHPANGKRERDATDAYRDPFWNHDVALLEQRRAMGFPNNFDAILK